MYPGFQLLPKGLKKMLVVSESAFFEEAKGSPNLAIGYQKQVRDLRPVVRRNRIDAARRAEAWRN
jgi:hypothetical protein